MMSDADIFFVYRFINSAFEWSLISYKLPLFSVFANLFSEAWGWCFVVCEKLRNFVG